MFDQLKEDRPYLSGGIIGGAVGLLICGIVGVSLMQSPTTNRQNQR